MDTVRISGWSHGAETISAIRLLDESTTLGLAESKRAIESVLEGIHIEVVPLAAAERLANGLRDCGFDAIALGERESL